MNAEITEKQKDCIDWIEEICRQMFIGTTKIEASEFIRKYIEIAKREQRIQNKLYAVVTELRHGNYGCRD